MLFALTIISVATFFSSLGFTALARRFAIRHNIGDLPNPRKVHKEFVPYLGGLGILGAVIVGTIISIFLAPEIAGPVPYKYLFLGIACTFITFIGLIDDLKGLKFSVKFYCQIAAALLVVIGGYNVESIYLPVFGTISLGLFSYIFTLLWIVFITNAMNLLDGLDGLASGVATIIFTIFAIIALHGGRTLVALINIILIMANLGFLRFNLHPAKIFMGDTGSLFLGFATSIISLEIGRMGDTNSLNLIVPLVVMILPVLDTTVSFFRRTSKHMHPFMADKEHIHHRLMSIGFTHENAVKVIYVFSVISGLMGISFIFLNDKGICTILIIGIILCGLLVRRLGYVEIEKNLIIVNEGEKNGNGKLNGLVNGNGETNNKFIPFETSDFLQGILFILSDTIFTVLAFVGVYFNWIAPQPFSFNALLSDNLPLLITWSVIFWTLALGMNDLYKIEWDTSRIDEIFTVLKVVIIGSIFLFLVSFEIPAPFAISRKILLLYGFFLVGGLSLGRLFLITILKNEEILGFKKRPTFIVGASSKAINVVKKIKSVPELKFNIVGYIDNHANGNIGKVMEGIPIIGSYENIPDLIRKYRIKEVIIALDGEDQDMIMDMIALFSQYKVSIKLLPDFYNLLSGFKTSHIYGVSLLRFFSSNMKTWEWLLKRFIDILISLLILIIFLPVWIIIGIIIVLDSPGPVFYKQKRIGKNKQEFEVIKFRSMIPNAEDESGPKWAEKDDPRVTRVGRFIRKFGLDEIPQFVNVLLGEMSIVGPRPERLYFVNELEKTIHFYSRRLIVKPGITGWAQIKYKYDETIDDVREKLRYDLYYIENMSVLLDLKIIAQTLLVGLRKKHQTAHL